MAMEKDTHTYTQQEASHTAVSLKYSKSSSFYLSTKKNFFTANQEHLEKSIKQNTLYASQPKRDLCKVCESPLPNSLDFHSHGVDYVFCSKCSQLKRQV